MPESEGVFQNRKVQFVLGVVGVIGLITLLSHMLGKSEEEEAAARSRRDKYRKTKPSFTDDEYADMGDVLEMALANGMTEDEQVIYDVFELCKNISDVTKIIQFYGSRRIALTIGGTSLPATIGTLFSKSEKNKLNGILAKKGIAYSFK